ncbi:MAG: YHS domain-containing protein, partial [Anaerolineae bacterium]|nr:YHS domain-containing protein [Anaerolineae bacterium]
MNPKLNAENGQQKDPVCNMTVSSDSKFSYQNLGKYFYFCSEHCLHKFIESPEQFLDKASFPPKINGNDSNTYTCPMHPEIQQQGPGSCPKCGMALEPLAVEAEEDTSELNDMSRRLWITAFLAIPVFFLAMVADLAPSLLPSNLSMQYVQWIEFALATPVVIWGGWPFYVRGVQSVITWNLNMFTLISLGVSVAWTYSTVALLFPRL